MPISDVSQGDNLISFLGKMPPGLVKNRFNYKNRLCFKILDNLYEEGLLEIVPKSFRPFDRGIGNIHFLSRCSSGIYLEYSGISEAGLGLGDFYREKIDFWIPCASPVSEDELSTFKASFFYMVEKSKKESSEHVPSEKELEKFEQERSKYFEVRETRDILSA